MATRESGGMGIDHLTVVPENLDAPAADEVTDAEDDGDDGEAAGGSGDAA